MKSSLRLSRALLPLLIACSTAASAEPRLHVDITQGTSELVAIGIPTVPSGSLEGFSGGDNAGNALDGVLRADLLGTGGYRLVGENIGAPATQVDFAPWKKLGTQVLVVGRVLPSPAGMLTYACSAYDVFGGTRELDLRYTVALREWRRAAHKCADAVFEYTTGDPGHFDTRIAYVEETGPKVGRTKRVAVMDYDGANQTLLTKGIELVVMPRFSPDTHSLVYMTYVKRVPRLVVYDLRQGTTRTLDLPAGTLFAPRFSPDGRSLAFSLGREGQSDIYLLDLDTNGLTRLTSAPGINTSPSFAPDGRKIAFESSRSGTQQIYVMARDGSGQTRISFGGARYASPAWSPRGDLIAFTRIGGSSFGIGVMRTDGSRERMLTDDWQDESPSWAPSGRAIAFLRTRRGDAQPELWTTDLVGRARHRIVIPAGGSDPDWSRRLP